MTSTVIVVELAYQVGTGQHHGTVCPNGVGCTEEILFQNRKLSLVIGDDTYLISNFHMNVMTDIAMQQHYSTWKSMLKAQ
jgi:hypothetical protein